MHSTTRASASLMITKQKEVYIFEKPISVCAGASGRSIVADYRSSSLKRPGCGFLCRQTFFANEMAKPEQRTVDVESQARPQASCDKSIPPGSVPELVKAWEMSLDWRQELVLSWLCNLCLPTRWRGLYTNETRQYYSSDW